MNNKEKRYTLVHYLFGALPARLGDEMSGQTILLLGLTTSGVSHGSTVLAGLTFSAAIGGPLLGAALDRARYPGRVLALSLALYALGISIIAMLIGHTPMWLSLGVALLVGLLMPSISGGWSGRLKSFIADEHIAKASAIDATTFNIAGLIGPAVAGLIVTAFGANWAVAILVALLVSALPMAWSLPNHIHVRAHAPSLKEDVLAGFKIIVTQKPLLRVTLLSTLSYLGIGMLWVASPLIGQEAFGNIGFGGVMMSTLSVGALIATAIYAKLRIRHSPDAVALATTVLLATAMLVLCATKNTIVLLIGMLLAGFADGPQLAAVFAIRHREAPEQSRSQVFTTGASLKITAAAAGALLAGHLARHSITATLLAMFFVQILAAAVYLALAKNTYNIRFKNWPV